MSHDRRTFLTSGAVSAAGLIALPRTTEAATWTAEETANVQIVNDFCASWKTGDVAKIVSFMTDDILFRNSGTQPMVGRNASFERIKGVFAQYHPIEFEVLETFAKGPIVMDDRNDYLGLPDGTRRTLRVVGVFRVRDGKIAEWTDYGYASR